LRLTLLYGGLFLLSGAALLGITYVLVAHASVRPGYVRSTRGVGVRNPHGHVSVHGGGVVASVIRGQRISDLHQLVIWSGIALAGMALASILLGWIVAGRALRPLRDITESAREISATNLHRRLGLNGPDDELKDLGDTIDALLARLEDSFQAQRAFVANASHELRTPLALSRAMLQFALADPELTFDSLKATCNQVLDAGADHEQLLEALLTLSSSQQELEQREPFELAATVEEVIELHRQQPAASTLTIEAELTPATISGDQQLVRRLATNLLDNAIHYNVPGGYVHIGLEARAEDAVLTLANTGPRVPAEQIERLVQPFRRHGPDRATDGQGHGLGLSIVAAVASAHDATLEIHPNPAGGLRVAVAFRSSQPSTGKATSRSAPGRTPRTGLPASIG
jgi:signal transduction histidine kinase